MHMKIGGPSFLWEQGPFSCLVLVFYKHRCAPYTTIIAQRISLTMELLCVRRAWLLDLDFHFLTPTCRRKKKGTRKGLNGRGAP